MFAVMVTSKAIDGSISYFGNDTMCLGSGDLNSYRLDECLQDVRDAVPFWKKLVCGGASNVTYWNTAKPTATARRHLGSSTS